MKSEAQRRAEAAHRERTVQVQVRFTLDEIAEVDAAAGKATRPKWLKAAALAAARKRKTSVTKVK